MGGLSTIRSYVKKATEGRHKRNKTGKRWETIQHCVLWEFGTNSVQLRERKNGPLAPKRHQMKHLDFFDFVVGIQAVFFRLLLTVEVAGPFESGRGEWI